MTIKTINPAAAVELLKKHRKEGNGRTFGVQVVSRTTNELKTMNCRFGVAKGLANGKRAYNPEAKGLMTVFENNRDGYRTLNLSGIRSLTMDGVTYQVQ